MRSSPAEKTFEEFMSQVRGELGTHASLNDIEKALLKHQNHFMQTLITDLQEEKPPKEEIFPPGS